MKITKKRLKAIILEEIKAHKAAKKAQNGRIQEDIRVNIAPPGPHLDHPEGNCGDHACTACAVDEPGVIDLSDFEPIYEEET